MDSLKGWLNESMRRIPPLLCILLIWFVASCGAPEPGGGRTPEKRVISLDPSVTSIILALDRDSWLVGVTKHCAVKGVPVVGDMRPRLARIVALRPDLVISGAYPYNTKDLDAMRAANLPLLSFPSTHLVDFRRGVKLLGKTLDAQDAANALIARLDREMDRARRNPPAQRPRVLLVYGLDAGYVYTSGGGDHVMELLALVGAENAAHGGPVTKRLSLSQTVALAPDLILHVSPDGRFPTQATVRAFWGRLTSIPAVKQGRIFLWTDNSLARRGAHLPETIARLSAVIRMRK